jgi:hypothetical protein
MPARTTHETPRPRHELEAAAVVEGGVVVALGVGTAVVAGVFAVVVVAPTGVGAGAGVGTTGAVVAPTFVVVGGAVVVAVTMVHGTVQVCSNDINDGNPALTGTPLTAVIILNVYETAPALTAVLDRVAIHVSLPPAKLPANP